MAQELVGPALILAGKRITRISDDLSSQSASELTSTLGIYNAIQALTLTGSNPGEVYNVRSYGGVPNGVIPATGNTATGTDSSAALQAAINAAPSNGFVYMGPGNWIILTPITITSKTLNILIDGNVITNGGQFLIFNAPGGADRQHTVIMKGTLYGFVNIVSHTKTRYTAGTGPNFASFTGAGITLGNNVNSMHVLLNKIEGFQAGIDIVVGGGNGCQENTFAVQKYYNNRYAIRMRSTDGVSWCDKNHFIGWDGGHTRVTGEVAVKIDGFSGAAATNGEIYNGAFRSNRIKILCESVTRICEVNGDATEPRFDLTNEAGLNTGVFDQANAIQCRSVAPNFVRGPKWCGDGILNTLWMTNGMGIDGRIDMPIYTPNSSGDAANLIGDKAKIDSAGQIHIWVKPNLPKANRDVLAVAPYNGNIQCVNEAVPKIFKNVPTSTYSNVSGDAYATLRFNFTTSTFNAVSANTNVGVWIRLQNIHASGTVTITGVTGIVSLAAGRTVDIEADGISWRAIINP